MHVDFADVQAGEGVEMLRVCGEIGVVEVLGVVAGGGGVEHGVVGFAGEDGGVGAGEVERGLDVNGGVFVALERTGACEHGAVGGDLGDGYAAGAVIVAVAELGDAVRVVFVWLTAEEEPAGDVLDCG